MRVSADNRYKYVMATRHTLDRRSCPFPEWVTLSWALYLPEKFRNGTWNSCPTDTIERLLREISHLEIENG